MFIKCPQCHTAYRIEMQTLPPQGIKMRCAKCRHIWRALPDPDTAPQTLPLEVAAFRFAFSHEESGEEPPVDFPDFPPPYHRRFAWLMLGLVLLLIATAATGWFFRQPVIDFFPQTEAIYNQLDNLYDQYGLSSSHPQIDNLIWGYENKNGHSAIRLRGEISNPSQGLLDIPSLNISLYGNNGKWLHNITVFPTESFIVPGGRIKFQTVFRAPPAAIKQIYAAFED